MLEPLNTTMAGPSNRRQHATLRRCRLQGLTLIEIMVGLAVMAILSALAVPAMGLRLERQRLAMAAETLAADLNEARFEVARTGRPQRLTALAPPDGQAWCWAIQPDQEPAASDCTCAAQRQCGYRSVVAADHAGVRMPQGRQVTLSQGLQGLMATVAVLESPHGERLRVDLMPLGRPRICSMSSVSSRYANCP